MLTVLHILGNETHESVHRNIYDAASFFLRHGVDVRFVYDPLRLRRPGAGYIEEIRALGAPMYQIQFLSRLHSLPGAALILREMCFAHHIDVIHTHSEKAYRLACAARFLGAPVIHIFTAHAVTARNPVEFFINKLLSAWCDEFIAIDEYTAGVLLERLIRVSKIKLINYGVDFSVWRAHVGRSQKGAVINTQHRGKMRKHNGYKPFTILMIADSDSIGDGRAFDAFADLILRLMHNADPQRVEYGGFRYIISTDSEYGLHYAHELSDALDLNNEMEIVRLSGPGDIKEMERVRLSGPGDGDDRNAGRANHAPERMGNDPAHTNYGPERSNHGPDRSNHAPERMSKGVIDDTIIKNWEKNKKMIKLRSFKYKVKSGARKGADANVLDFDSSKTLCYNAGFARRKIYKQADLCLYYSENRFFPYPAAESIAIGIPTMTNDRTFMTGIAMWEADDAPGADAELQHNAADAQHSAGAVQQQGEGAVQQQHAADAQRSEGAEPRPRAVAKWQSGGADDAQRGSSGSGSSGSGSGGSGDAGSSSGGDATDDDSALFDDENDSQSGIFEYGFIDFNNPDDLARRVLDMIGDDGLRASLASAENDMLRARHDINDMISGTYNLYVKGLRV